MPKSKYHQTSKKNSSANALEYMRDREHKNCILKEYGVSSMNKICEIYPNSTQPGQRDAAILSVDPETSNSNLQSPSSHPQQWVIQPSLTTVFLVSMVLFANTAPFAACVETTNPLSNTKTLFDFLQKMEWPNIKTCNKPSNAIQAVHATYGEYFVYPEHSKGKEKPCGEELDSLRQQHVHQLEKKKLNFNQKNHVNVKACPKEIAKRVEAYFHSYIEVNEFTTMAITNNKANCDEMSRAALDTMRKEPELSSFPKGLLTQISPGDDGHNLAIIFSNTIDDIEQTYNLDLKQLARIYPNAIIIDLWNGIKFPIKSIANEKTFAKYVEARFDEIGYKPDPTQKKTIIGDVYRYYLGFKQHRLQVLNRPQHECINNKLDQLEHHLGY